MSVRVRRTRRADEDFAEIFRVGAAEFGIAQAEQYAAGLIEAFDLLSRHPPLARERTEFRRPVRLHPHGAHLIAYTVDDEGVLIVRLLHGRQDWRRHLFP